MRNGCADNYNDNVKVLIKVQMPRESQRLLNQRKGIIMTDILQHMLLNMGVMNNELLRQLRGTLKVFARLFPIQILVDSGGDYNAKFQQYERAIRKFAPPQASQFVMSMPETWPGFIDVDLSNQSKPRKQWGKKQLVNRKPKRMELFSQLPKMSGFRGKKSPASAPSLQVPDLNPNPLPMIPPKRRRLMKGPGYVYQLEDGTWGS